MKYQLSQEQFNKLWTVTEPLGYDFFYRYDRQQYWRDVCQPKYKLKYLEERADAIISGEQKYIEWFLLQL
jgi:hypothetical protein